MDTYRTKDLAGLLNISDSSIRKYSIALKAAGISFQNDAKGERLYDEQDYKAFAMMRQQISKGSTMKDAAIQAAALLLTERQARREAGQFLMRTDRELIASMAERIEALAIENAKLRREQVDGTAKLHRELADIKDTLMRLENGVKDAEMDEEKPEQAKPGLFDRLFGRK